MLRRRVICNLSFLYDVTPWGGREIQYREMVAARRKATELGNSVEVEDEVISIVYERHFTRNKLNRFYRTHFLILTDK